METFPHVFRTVLSQVVREVDEEGAEEGHHFMAVPAIRINEKSPQSSKLHFILLRF